MRTIIILSVFTQIGLAQQSQQFLVNNLSNINIQNNNRGNINFTNVMLSNNAPLNSNKPKVVSRPTVRPRTTTTFNQINRINANKAPVTAQVRRARPRSTPRVAPTNNTNIQTPSNQNNINNNDINAPIVNEINMPDLQLKSNINEAIQVQNFVNVDQGSNPFPQQENTNVGNQFNLNMDLSINLNGLNKIKVRESSSSTSNRSTNRIFYKKLAKFKRNFFGKLSSHKKSKHRLDVCFNWKK